MLGLWRMAKKGLDAYEHTMICLSLNLILFAPFLSSLAIDFFFFYGKILTVV